jgi:hypothetical protein
MNTDRTITAQLERIEAKLDLVLEKLKWEYASSLSMLHIYLPPRKDGQNQSPQRTAQV